MYIATASQIALLFMAVSQNSHWICGGRSKLTAKYVAVCQISPFSTYYSGQSSEIVTSQMQWYRVAPFACKQTRKQENTHVWTGL